MGLKLPVLGLTTKLMALMVMLLAVTLGAQLLDSLRTQQEIIDTTQERVKDLAGAIQISVQELTSVAATDRTALASYVQGLGGRGLEVSIASDRRRIINSSNPQLIGTALTRAATESATVRRAETPRMPLRVIPIRLGPPAAHVVAYLIPVEVEDHLMGYVELAANFSDFSRPLRESRLHLLTVAIAILTAGLLVAYVLAERYVKPIHEVAAAAQNIVARGLETVPESGRRDEIGLLTRSFNEMVIQLRHAREREQELNRLERFTALGQLGAGLAHEIKNPLNFISLALDQLRTRYASQLSDGRDNFLSQLGIMKNEVRRLSGLLQSFLQYGKPIEIHPASTDLRQIVDEVLALSDSKLKSQDIEVEKDAVAVDAILNADAEKLRICFVNVVANAIQAMPEGGRLRIGFERADTTLKVVFSDTGAGIDPQVASRAFEPFFTTKREGIGLGLFLSQAIMEKHGGGIEIRPNEPGPGTSVTFVFPLDSPEKA